jgi:hypothetical protein
MQEGTGDIHRHDRVPILEGHVDHELAHDTRGVVHEDVELAEVFGGQRDGLAGGLAGGILPRDIRHEGHDARSLQALDVGVDIFSNHLGAAGVQQFCNRAADAAGCPGHDGDLAFDFVHGR